MTAKETLIRLVKLQEVVDQTRQAEHVVESAPHRIEEIEAHFRERNAEFVAIRDRYDELELDRKTRSAELETLEQSRQKYTDDLMQVKNQKEYAAMLKEIDGVKAQISEHEEAILRDMEEIDKLQGELATHEDHIAREREAVGRESEEVRSAESAAREKIEQLRETRRELEHGLDHSTASAVRRLEDRRQGIFLSVAADGTCQSCFVRVRPQVYQEIRLAAAVHSCGNCRRFLYDPESLETPAESRGESTPRPDGIEAVNGGAV